MKEKTAIDSGLASKQLQPLESYVETTTMYVAVQQ